MRRFASLWDVDTIVPHSEMVAMSQAQVSESCD